MERVTRFFEAARCCTPATRRAGVEVETLCIDTRTGQPLLLPQSQAVFAAVSAHEAWQVSGMKGPLISTLSSVRGSGLLYELGAGNIEFITAPMPLAALRQGDWQAELREVMDVLEALEGQALDAAYDGMAALDNLVLPDARDQVWRELDGPVLTVLGHIASVHLNIDLTSLNEGMEMMRTLETFRRERQWPPRDVQACWDRYLEASHAQYEPGRYGPPPTRSFEEYCRVLASLKVVMRRDADGFPTRCQPARPLMKTNNVDMDLFVRSVWWYCRLRVRGGQLVLEIRFIPRGSDADLQRDLLDVLSALRLF